MSLQRNVQQQIEVRKAEIRRAVRLFAACAASINWLRPLLESNGISMDGGALVRFVGTPEQGGTLYSGLWLTADRDFWEFAVFVARETSELLEVELLSNATNTVEMAKHLPGIQKSFGTLAIEVVEETLHG